MALLTFGRKDKASAGGKKAAPRLELVFDETNTRALAFGVQWRSIATAGGRDEAVKLARQVGATHYIFRGQQLGLGALNGADAASAASARIYPAAAVAARHMVGNAICALRIQPGEYWIAAVANGAPTSTDLFLQGIDDAQALERVRQVASQVYAGAQAEPAVYTNIDGSGIEGVKAYSDEDLFQALVSGSEVLAPLPKAGASIPKPVLIAAAAVAVLLVGQQANQWWTKKKAREAAMLADSSEIDPAQAWAQEIANWEASRAAANGYGLLEARDQLTRLPVRWEGWSLTTAVCRAASLSVANGTAQRSWTCAADYTRSRVGSVNRKMASILPAGWVVSFTPLNGLRVSWNFVQPARPLKLADLPKADFYRVEVASRLQVLQPALAGDVSYTFAPVDIPPPRKKDGTAFPPPPEVQGLTSAAVVVKGPMRSMDALIKADVAANWQEISITYDNQEPKGALNASSLMAEAKGEMYARN